MSSLLGRFYNKIRGSQEDIASESLVHILENSFESRKVIIQIVKQTTGLNLNELTFSSQNVGENLERPDIQGIDETGKEVLLIEAKFWASLTKNQPNGYLERLSSNTALMFLTPTLRVRTIFEEVKNSISTIYDNLEVDLDNHSLLIKDTDQHIFIKSWNEVLNAIKIKLQENNKINELSDLNQIIGLCDSIDKNSFSPIVDEDLSPKIAKNINSYYEVIDKVVDELKKKNQSISTDKLLKSPQRYGYHRYFKTEKLGMSFNLKFDLWEKYADTPFWLSVSEINNKNWEANDKFKNHLNQLCTKNNLKFIDLKDKNGVYVSLKPKLYETEDIVIKDFSNQINQLVQQIESLLSLV